MLVNISIAKVNKHGKAIGGDTAEIVERPLGGVTGIIVDGQGSGKAAKIISNAIVGKITTLISDGARDGAVARAVQDYLFTIKDGRVSATLTMVSVALDTNSIIITRSGHCPVLVMDDQAETIYDDQVNPLGFYKFSKPQINEIPLKKGLTILAYSDGLLSAGKRYNNIITQEQIISLLREDTTTQTKADKILELALELDKDRPNDDTTVLIMEIVDTDNKNIRKITSSYPI